MQLLSLEEIRVRTGGTNRQRLHRGIQEAQEHVQQHLNVLSLFLDYFEEKSKCLQENLGTHPLEFETLIEPLLPDPGHVLSYVGRPGDGTHHPWVSLVRLRSRLHLRRGRKCLWMRHWI